VLIKKTKQKESHVKGIFAKQKYDEDKVITNEITNYDPQQSPFQKHADKLQKVLN
jgi:hypothetical protein